MTPNASWVEALWAWYTLWATGIHARAFISALRDQEAAKEKHIDGPVQDLGKTRILYTFALTTAQVCFFLPGSISLFRPPAPDANIQAADAIAVLGLFLGELILGLASFFDQWRREKLK